MTYSVVVLYANACARHATLLQFTAETPAEAAGLAFDNLRLEDDQHLDRAVVFEGEGAKFYPRKLPRWKAVP